MTKFYNFLVYIFLFLILITSFSCSAEGNPTEEPNVDISFEKRTFELHVPSTYDESNPSPLLFVFHGFSHTGAIARTVGGFDEMGEEQRFIIVYPDAFAERWADGCFCNEADLQGVDDVLFVDYLLEEIKSQYAIDTSRIYAAGISQGGIFVHWLACRRADKFAAFGTIIGSMRDVTSRRCEPASPINLVMVNSTNDNDMVWDGFIDGPNTILSTPNVMLRWAGFAGCSGNFVTEELPENGLPLISVEKRTYTDCNSGKDLVLYAVIDGIHRWYRNREIDASELLMDFFKEH